MTDKKEDSSNSGSTSNADPKKKSTESDPQEKMEGPISSIMQGIKEDAEDNDDETKKEADEKKDKNL